MFERDGKLTGITLDIFREIQRRADFIAIVYPLPARRMVMYGEKGILDGVLQVFYDSNRKTLIYADFPTTITAYSVFINPDNPNGCSGNTLESLQGKIVGWNSGYRLTPDMRQAIQNQRFKLEEVKETSQNLKKLLGNRIDCFINNKHLTQFFIKELHLSGNITSLDAPFYPTKGTYMAISRDGSRIKDKTAFLKRFNQALGSIQRDGTDQKIMNRYLK